MDSQADRSALDLFSEALALPEEVRGAFLDRACGGDAMLRAEIESLLALHPAARRFFDRAERAAVFDRATPDPADPRIGSAVGPYRITRLLASGGMGSVYAGERTDEAYRKQVAIKLVRPGLWNPEVLQRFRTERQVLADLDHPGIARLIDGGSLPDGQPYLVMEYVEGQPIDRYARERGLTLAARLELFLQVCDAVHYAHRNLVIHRDLKPGNIHVESSGRVKLLDFGIAKVVTPAEGSLAGIPDATVTLHAFTPRYASPEQVRGERMTTSTDVYSLGVVLYELLTGQSPHRLEGKTIREVEEAICLETPMKPSRAVRTPPARALREGGAGAAHPLARRLEGDLDTILLKALQREPERRYAGVDEFAADVRRHLADQPVLARPDTARYRISRFVRREKGLVAAATAVLIILSAALAVTFRALTVARARTAEASWQAYVGSLAAAESSILANRVGEAIRHLEAAPAALRGWEWHHLKARTDRSLAGWRAHSRGVTGLVAAADGRTVVSTSLDSTAALWESVTGRLLRRWGPFDSPVESAAILPEQQVILGLENGRVLIVRTDVDAAEDFHMGPGWAMVAVSGDGSKIVAGFFDGAMKVWDASTRRLLASWQTPGRFPIPLWTRSSAEIITGEGDGWVRIWQASTGRMTRQIRAHDRRVYCVTLDPDGRRLATGSMDRTAAVWDLEKASLVQRYHEHKGTIAGVAFLSGGAEVVSTGADGNILRWDTASGATRSEWRGSRADAYCLEPLPGGAGVLSGDWDGAIHRWDPFTEDVRVFRIDVSRGSRDRGAIPILDLVPRATDVAIHADASRTVADPARSTGRAMLTFVTNIGLLPIWPLEGARSGGQSEAYGIHRVAFTPDGARLLAAGDSGFVTVWDPETGERTRRLEVRANPVLALAVDPDGSRFATAGADSLVQLWSLPEGRFESALRGDWDAVNDLAFSPTGDRLAAACQDGAIRLLEAATGRVLRTLRGHAAPVRDVSFSPDGREIVSAAGDHTFRLWDALGDRPPRELYRMRGEAAAAVFTADGSRVILGGTDEVLHFFDRATGREVVTLRGHVSRVSALAVSGDGRFIASASFDGSTRVWDIPAESAAGLLRRR